MIDGLDWMDWVDRRVVCAGSEQPVLGREHQNHCHSSWIGHMYVVQPSDALFIGHGHKLLMSWLV
jgi:hypothetical protein